MRLRVSSRRRLVSSFEFVMPQPIRTVPFSFDFGQSKMRMRSEHMLRIGLICHEWALLEINLHGAFLALSGGEEASAITGTIFDALESLKLRLDVIGKLIHIRVPSLESEYTETIKPLVRKVARKRNLIVHGKWGTNDKYPNDLILVTMTAEVTRYSITDFDQIIEQISVCQGLVGRFVHKIEAAPNKKT